MPINEFAGKVQTVLGLIDPDALGRTLTHEHILFNGSWPPVHFVGASEQTFYDQPVSQEMLGRIRHRMENNKDNGRLDDIQTAIDEVSLYKQHGGGTIVDATSIGIGRDPVGLRRISTVTCLNIVMGGSYYVSTHHLPEVNDFSEDEILE